MFEVDSQPVFHQTDDGWIDLVNQETSGAEGRRRARGLHGSSSRVTCLLAVQT